LVSEPNRYGYGYSNSDYQMLVWLSRMNLYMNSRPIMTAVNSLFTQTLNYLIAIETFMVDGIVWIYELCVNSNCSFSKYVVLSAWMCTLI
jgi:hypothetical protein